MSTSDDGIKYSPHRIESTATPDAAQTPRTDEQCYAVPVEEQCAATLEHYEEISAKACHWSNQVPQAIRFWYLERPKLERENTALRAQLAAAEAELGSTLAAMEDWHCESDGCMRPETLSAKATEYRKNFHAMKKRADAAEAARVAAIRKCWKLSITYRSDKVDLLPITDQHKKDVGYAYARGSNETGAMIASEIRAAYPDVFKENDDG